MEKTPTIAILTDYGTADPFVGILKGVIWRIAPEAGLIDLTHGVPPGDVRAAAMQLWQAHSYFPEGTVFLCVVDPGVGTARRGLLVQSGGQIFIGPDNGLFTFILADGSQAWELANPDLMLPNPGTTFHGRDIFAPAAAHAARGVPGSAFGPRLTDPQRLEKPVLHFEEAGEIRGEVLLADHFGNLLTSLGRWSGQATDRFVLQPWLPATGQAPADPVIIGPASTLQLPDGKRLRWASTFAAIAPSEAGFLVGGSGLIEIAANQDSAERRLNLAAGEAVILYP